jgi:DNA-binding winged helix-turn-helix (wHTH) protein
MHDRPDANGPLRVGPFELDVRARELRKDGRRVHLQDKPFELIAALVERHGEVVSREELRQRLWPADTFVAFDDSLNTAINKAREALGDSAESPRFIETVPRRGYRFVGPVSGNGYGPLRTIPVPATRANGEPATRRARERVRGERVSTANEPRARLRAEGASARSRRSVSGGGNGASRRRGERESV